MQALVQAQTGGSGKRISSLVASTQSTPKKLKKQIIFPEYGI